MTCFECGAPGPLHDHHVVPASKGGTRTVKLCEECHGIVHEQDMRTSALISEALRKKRSRRERYTSTIPYGYRLAANGIALLDAPQEQAVVRAIRIMRDRLGMTWQAIADRLNGSGIPSNWGCSWYRASTRKVYLLGME